MELESISFSTTGDSLQELLSRIREDKAVMPAHHYVDMRKSINGLAGILQGEDAVRLLGCWAHILRKFN